MITNSKKKNHSHFSKVLQSRLIWHVPQQLLVVLALFSTIPAPAFPFSHLAKFLGEGHYFSKILTFFHNFRDCYHITATLFWATRIYLAYLLVF